MYILKGASPYHQVCIACDYVYKQASGIQDLYLDDKTWLTYSNPWGRRWVIMVQICVDPQLLAMDAAVAVVSLGWVKKLYEFSQM